MPHREPDPDMDPQPDPDPHPHSDTQRYPYPNNDAHERTVYGPHGATNRLWVTVLDANGDAVARGDAVIRRDDAPPGLGPTYTIRYTDLVLRGRELLPVRPDVDTGPPYPNANPYITPIHHAVHHFHGHGHPTHPNAHPVEYRHAHVHVHTGADADRAGRAGHHDASHDHTHKRDGERGPRGVVGPSEPPWR